MEQETLAQMVVLGSGNSKTESVCVKKVFGQMKSKMMKCNGNEELVLFHGVCE